MSRRKEMRGLREDLGALRQAVGEFRAVAANVVQNVAMDVADQEDERRWRRSIERAPVLPGTYLEEPRGPVDIKKVMAEAEARIYHDRRKPEPEEEESW